MSNELKNQGSSAPKCGTFHEDDVTNEQGSTTDHIDVSAPYYPGMDQDMVHSNSKVKNNVMDKGLKDFFKARVLDMNRLPGEKTMANVHPNYKVPSGHIYKVQESRKFFFQNAPTFHPTDQVTEIRDEMIKFGAYLKKAGVFEIIHGSILDKINKFRNHFIIQLDSEVLMDELLKANKVSDQTKQKIFTSQSLKHQLLLFLDSFYPVHDFISWFERNYQKIMLDFKTIFAYFVFKNFLLEPANFQRDIIMVDEILMKCDDTCDQYMRKYFQKTFDNLLISTKFFILGSDHYLSKQLFCSHALDNNRTLSERIVRTQSYLFDDDVGIYGSIARANRHCHNEQRNDFSGFKNRRKPKRMNFGNSPLPSAYDSSSTSVEASTHPHKPKKIYLKNKKKNSRSYSNLIFLNDDDSDSE